MKDAKKYSLPRWATLRQTKWVPAVYEKKDGHTVYTGKKEGTGIRVVLDPARVLVHTFVSCGEAAQEIYLAACVEFEDGRLEDVPVGQLTMEAEASWS